jgi:peptidoglycan/LPS O-acetylase OafA/YrhL
MISLMMGIGTIRFLLAIAVVLLHADFVTFEVAQIAVLTFFFISGFLMERSFPRYTGAGRFLINRAIRLIPTFLLVSFLTWSVIALASEEFRRSFGFIYLRSAASYNLENPPQLSAFGGVEWDGAIPYLGFESEFVPQAWSIGNEMLYYLTVPLLALLSIRWIASIVLGSLFLLVVLVRTHYSDFDYSVYTNLIATYIFFVAGYLLSKAFKKKMENSKRRTARYLAFGMIVTSYFLDFADTSSPLLVLGTASILISLITVGFLHDSHQMVGEEAPSKFLGKLSYPLYISHMITIGLLNALSILSIPTAIISSTALATVFYLVVDGPLESLRSRVRK